jgi:hypothetical protein
MDIYKQIFECTFCKLSFLCKVYKLNEHYTPGRQLTTSFRSDW